VTSQASFYSANDQRLHFGLGAETTADIEVHWPNGNVEHVKAIRTNQLVTIQEATGVIPSKGWPVTKSKFSGMPSSKGPRNRAM
jgi:ASPIC and UnbV